MSTTKELRAAAEHFAAHKSCECDHESGVFNCMGCDIDRMASHILATTRDDDDEPVTDEWCREIGFTDRHCDSSISLGGTVIVDLWGMEVTVCNARPDIKTRGQLRSLLSALAVPVE